MRTLCIVFLAAIVTHGMSGAVAAAEIEDGHVKKWPLQERIDGLARNGGGTLVLTAGVYRTGALFFKPGVNLRLEKGATIVGVDESDGYPMRETRIEGETCTYYPALVNADCCDGFTISGDGVIDGHGADPRGEKVPSSRLLRGAGRAAKGHHREGRAHAVPACVISLASSRIPPDIHN